VEVEKMLSCKDESRGGFGIIVRLAMNIDLFHLDATQDYVLVVGRGIQTNGHQNLLID